MKQTEKGLCIFCLSLRIPNSTLCEKHYFKSLAQRNLQDMTKWELIRDIFYAQEERCYFTGKKLVLGINASIDHLQPTSRCPELMKSVENIRWVDKDINRIKSDLTSDEFIELCKTIARLHT